MNVGGRRATVASESCAKVLAKGAWHMGTGGLEIESLTGSLLDASCGSPGLHRALCELHHVLGSLGLSATPPAPGGVPRGPLPWAPAVT